MPASGSPTIAESCRARRGSGVRSKQWPTNSPAVAKPMAGRHEWLRMKAAESGNWKTERTNREIGRPGNRADKSRNLETGKLGNRKMDPRADGQAPKPDPPGCPGSVVPYYSLRAPRKQRRVVAGRVEAGRTPPGSARSAGSGQAPPATGFLPSPAKPSFAFWTPVESLGRLAPTNPVLVIAGSSGRIRLGHGSRRGGRPKPSPRVEKQASDPGRSDIP